MESLQKCFDDIPWIKGMPTKLIISIFGFIGLIVFISLLIILGKNVWLLLTGKPDEAKNIGLFTLALISAPFGIWRLFIHDKQSRTAHQQRINEMLTKGVELLCSCRVQEKAIDDENGIYLGKQTTTVPNSEIRLGAVRILQEVYLGSPSERAAVYDILKGIIRSDDSLINVYTDESIAKYVLNLEPLSIDKQQALKTVGDKDRPNEGEIDLSNSYLARINITKLYFRKIDFSSSNLAGATAKNCEFNNSIFGNTRLEQAKFFNCDFTEVIFSDCPMPECSFENCKLDRLLIDHCHFHEDSHFTNCQGKGIKILKSDLSKVLFSSHSKTLEIDSLENCFLYKTSFSNIDLAKTSLKDAYIFDVDLSETGVNQRQLNAVAAGKDVKLPMHMHEPPHWKEQKYYDHPVEDAASATKFDEWSKWEQAHDEQ